MNTLIRSLVISLIIALITACGGGGDTGGGSGGGSSGGSTPTITSFVASAVTINSGSSVNLTAVFANGTGSIDNGVGSVTSGVAKSASPTSTTTYTLTVTNTAGTAVTSAVTVSAALTANTVYTPSNLGSGYYKLTMPIDGKLDFSLLGTTLSIYDTSLSLLHSTTTYDRDVQFDLLAGEYLVNFNFWSANSKHAIFYSPALLSPSALTALENKTYSTSQATSRYYKLIMPMDGNIVFSGQGTNVAINNNNLERLVSSAEDKGVISLVAGNYIVKMRFWSANAKSMAVYSTAL